MTDTAGVFRYPVIFFVLYALTYMCNAIYMTFMPIYLDQLGFTRSIIGTLLALGPFVAIIAQPIWGMVGDRANTKNSVLKVMLLGSALAIILYPVSSNYYYLVGIIAAFTFFQTSVNPMSDAITLEYISNTSWKYGPIRLAGTIGYAVMAVMTGIITKQNINSIFPLYLLIAAMALVSSFKIPRVKGHQSKNSGVTFWNLFKNRELVALICFNLIIQTTLGIYYSFFPIYFRQIGADNILLGIAMFISAISEIPFLLFADKILGRLGIKLTLILSAAIMGLRWLLIYILTNIYSILFLSITHGFSFVVFTYCLATYIGKEVPKELRASGQMINGLIGFGISRVFGSVLGGLLSDKLGLNTVFLCSSTVNFIAVLVFGCIFIIGSKPNTKVEA